MLTDNRSYLIPRSFLQFKLEFMPLCMYTPIYVYSKLLGKELNERESERILLILAAPLSCDVGGFVELLAPFLL